MTGAYDHSWYLQLRPKPEQYNTMSAGAGQASQSRACGCVGPQNGQPRCPCMMRNVKEVDGRWVEVIDHGPVREGHSDELRRKADWSFKYLAELK